MPHKVLTLTGWQCRLGYLQYHNSMFESDNFIQSLATVFLKTHLMHRPWVSPWRSKLGCWETKHKLSSHCQGGPRWYHTVMSVICLSSVAGHQDVIRMSRSQTNRPWNAWPWNLPQLGTKRSASKASKSSSSSSSTTTCRTCRLACTAWCLLHTESTSLLNQGVKEGSEGQWCDVLCIIWCQVFVEMMYTSDALSSWGSNRKTWLITVETNQTLPTLPPLPPASVSFSTQSDVHTGSKLVTAWLPCHTWQGGNVNGFAHGCLCTSQAQDISRLSMLTAADRSTLSFYQFDY